MLLKYNSDLICLESSTTATSLLPGGVRWNRSAILDTSNLHASSGQCSNGVLCSRSGGLGSVSSGGSQLDVESSDSKGLHLAYINCYKVVIGNRLCAQLFIISQINDNK